MRTHFSHCVLLVAFCVNLSWFSADAAAEVRNPNGFAVIVGNKDYKDNDIPKVSFAHRDAAAFKRYVVDVLGFDPKNIIYLHDATRAQLRRTFGSEKKKKSTLWSKLLPNRKRKWDVVVFYSGHGVPGRNDGRGYLLPVDVTPDEAQEEGYPIELLYKKLGRLVEARSVQVYLDACFSGSSAGGSLVQNASAADRRLVLPKDSMGKVTRVTAAGAGQIASWDKKAGHGLFTHYLLNALYGKADENGDKKVTAKEAKIYLDAYMTRAAYSEYEREQDADVESAEGAVLASAPPGGFPERPTLASVGEEAGKKDELKPFGPDWEIVKNQPCQIYTKNKVEGASVPVTWTGDCVEGRGSGYGRMEVQGPYGEIVYIGELRGGKQHGYGTYKWIAGFRKGNRYEGYFLDGKRNGRGVYTWSSGNRYEGYFLDGKRNGRGVYTWQDGTRYEGDFVDGKLNGRGVYTWSSGNRYEGYFLDGKRNGRGVYTWQDGTRYEGQFRDGKQHGYGTVTYHDGGSYKGSMVQQQTTWTGCFY